jgi:transcription elongation factor Elf1
MKEDRLPFTCPICGRKTEHPIANLVEGATLTCPFCKLNLTLHGHMLEDVQREIEKLRKKQ